MATESTGEPGAQYRKLAADLREAITSGDFGPSGRLPSEQRLAEQYGVSRGTVRHALAVLRTNGLVTSRRGTRRVILGTARTQSFVELLSFTEWARSMGEDPGGRTVSIHRGPAGAAEGEQLQVEPGAEVVHVVRVRTLSRVPVMVERTTYPEHLGDLIAGQPDDAVSHTDPLTSAGVVFADAEHTIDMVRADADDARLLGCPEGSYLLRERRRSTDPAGTPLVWSDDRFLPGTVSFTVHNSAATTSLARRRA